MGGRGTSFAAEQRQEQLTEIWRGFELSLCKQPCDSEFVCFSRQERSQAADPGAAAEYGRAKSTGIRKICLLRWKRMPFASPCHGSVVTLGAGRSRVGRASQATWGRPKSKPPLVGASAWKVGRRNADDPACPVRILVLVCQSMSKPRFWRTRALCKIIKIVVRRSAKRRFSV